MRCHFNATHSNGIDSFVIFDVFACLSPMAVEKFPINCEEMPFLALNTRGCSLYIMQNYEHETKLYGNKAHCHISNTALCMCLGKNLSGGFRTNMLWMLVKTKRLTDEQAVQLLGYVYSHIVYMEPIIINKLVT